MLVALPRFDRENSKPGRSGREGLSSHRSARRRRRNLCLSAGATGYLGGRDPVVQIAARILRFRYARLALFCRNDLPDDALRAARADQDAAGSILSITLMWALERTSSQ